jgi:hypothetical protein
MWVCASCGQENPDGFKFCGNCGAPLAAPTPAREVRKVVTIVFCDLTGSTALGDRTDPETLRATMRGYYDEMRTILERHGGTVEKFVGDAVMAVFGVPVSREDDALRAVRAAWEMRTAVGVLGLQARRRVHDVTCDHRLASARAGVDVHERFPGVDGDADLEPAVLDEAVTNRERRPDRAFGIVLTCDGCAEHRHHGVADELLDGPAALLELRAQTLVVRAQDRLDVLRVQRLGTRREADEVGEEDGDDLALASGVHRTRSTG